MNRFAEQQNRIDCTVFRQRFRQHGIQFGRRFVRAGDVNEPDILSRLLCNSAAEIPELRADIAVKEKDVMRRSLPDKFPGNSFVAHDDPV